MTNDCRDRHDRREVMDTQSCSKSKRQNKNKSIASNTSNSKSSGLINKYYRNVNTQHSPESNSVINHHNTNLKHKKSSKTSAGNSSKVQTNCNSNMSTNRINFGLSSQHNSQSRQPSSTNKTTCKNSSKGSRAPSASKKQLNESVPKISSKQVLLKSS